MKTLKVLFIEDDMDMGYLISKGLENAGFDVAFRNTLDGFRETLAVSRPDVLLLDLEVGSRNSSEELSFIRTLYPSLPIVVASSHTSGKEIGDCLNAGVDYYIKKPYELAEVIPLLHKLCPAGSESVAECICFGPYRLDLSNRALYCNNRRMHALNPKEFQLLSLLAARPGEIVKRADILQHVWQNENAGDSLNNYITYLRNYLKSDPDIEIQTVKGIGCCLLLRHKPGKPSL